MRRFALSWGMAVLVLAIALPRTARAGAGEAIIWGGAVNSNVFGGDGGMLGDDSRSGVTTGVSLLWTLHEHIGLELGGRYTQKGTRGQLDTRYTDEDTSGGFVLDATVNLDYIEVPLLVSGVLAVGEKAEIRAYLGLSANFLVSSRVTGTLDGRFFEQPVENVTGIDWAAAVGFSYEYRMNTASVVFDARFVGSIRSIEDSPDFDADVKLRAFEFSLGLGIPLGEGHF